MNKVEYPAHADANSLAHLNGGIHQKAMETFLEVLRIEGVLRPALKAAKINRTILRQWQAENPEFAAECNEALEEAMDIAEEELRRRALKGTQKLVLVKGQPVPLRNVETGEIELDENFEPIMMTETVHHDRLLETYIKGNRTRYKDKVTENEISINADSASAKNGIKIHFVEPKTIEHKDDEDDFLS